MLLAACSSGSSNNEPDPIPEPEPVAPPTAPYVPAIAPEVVDAARIIGADPKVAALLADWRTPENAKARFNQHMELVRIASPSREEMRKADEIHRRMREEWGFSADEIKTRQDGHLEGADLQIVDGLPVYNTCVEIQGSYAGSAGAQSYRGQYPKVMIESHIDVVFPESLPPADDPYQRLRLQPMSEPVVTSPAQLAAITDELNFDAEGRIIEDAAYERASRHYANAQEAQAAGAVRIYVPGYGDAMADVSGVMSIAQGMKKHGIKPVYDIWICGTAGEEGKGNLAGMKQLYGYDQSKGIGTNPLNFVTNFGLDSGNGTINFIGSYRFEMKFKAPVAPAGQTPPSALEAAAGAVARIAEIRTPWDDDNAAPKTTYTVGTASCEALSPGASTPPSCSIMVDMRSPRIEPLNEIRSRIEPAFQAAVSAENARRNVADGTPQAVTLEQVWFGDRPPHERMNPNDVAIQAAWQSAESVGVDRRATQGLGSSSLNDNVPAAVGVPTISLSSNSIAATAGLHTFWEWGVRGDPEREVLRMQRVMTAALIAAGFNTADGRVVPPAADPIGARTADTE